MCLLICLVIYLFLQLLLLGGRSEYLFCFVFYCCCFLLFSPWGEGYFNMLVGRMKDSSSAGQSMTYISILEAYICFREEWEVLGVSMKSVFIILYYCIYPKYIFTNFFVVFTCSSRLRLYMCLSLCVCLCTNAWLYSCL